MDFKKEIAAGRFLSFIRDGKPIIFWDACALLEILRIPMNTKKLDVESLKNYESLAEAIESEKVISVTSYMVGFECNNNFNQVDGALLRFDKDSKGNVIKLASFMDDESKRNEVVNGVSNIDVLDRFYSVLKRISENTYIIKYQKTLPANMKPDIIAHDRVLHKEAPASQKGEYKDCYIWATYISIMKAGAPESNCVFFTTNTRDYKDTTTQKPFSRLESDISFSDNVHISFDVKYAAYLLNCVPHNPENA